VNYKFKSNQPFANRAEEKSKGIITRRSMDAGNVLIKAVFATSKSGRSQGIWQG
jgi:hypothetical protein